MDNVMKKGKKQGKESVPKTSKESMDTQDIPEEPDEFNKMHLEAHNKYRKLHGVPPLVWSGKLQRNAYRWAAVNAK